jgi:hypothetical protein
VLDQQQAEEERAGWTISKRISNPPFFFSLPKVQDTYESFKAQRIENIKKTLH